MAVLTVRHILHADLDAFYAAVEQLDDPHLRGKPVLVGGRPEDRGVVATASYEARRYGVHSAMPMRVAVRRCPQGIIVRPRFDRYKEVSRQVMAIFHDLTDLVEPLSLDEAYLDITGVVTAGASFPGRAPLLVAIDLKYRVKAETGLTLSVGAATSKSVAKIASDLQKPDGLVVVPPGEEREFLSPLPVEKVWGIGPKTAARLHQEGIETIGQLANQTLDWFIQRFGKRAASVQQKALGQDTDPVRTERATKSVSAETTFASDLSDPERLYEELSRLSTNVARHLERQGLWGKTVTVKLRLADFTTLTRQVTLPAPTGSHNEIREMAWRLLSVEAHGRAPLLAPGRAFRLLGVGVSTLTDPSAPLRTGVQQLPLPLSEDSTDNDAAGLGGKGPR